MDYFWIDEERELRKTYSDLLNDLRRKRYSYSYIYFDNPYEIILEIIHSLIQGRTVELLYSDFSTTEIANLGIEKSELKKYESASVRLTSISDLYASIEKGKLTWKIGIYTSGTTGRPKKVYHTFNSITRNIKIGDKFRGNVWAFAYNPTHFAGLQVLLQALMNMNPMVYIFESKKDRIESLLKKYRVTNISATPTFYKMIIPVLKNPVDSVRRVTFGGERFDNTILKMIKTSFPNAKIRNIYASTEAGSLFTAEGDVFVIPEKITKFVKIQPDGELLIHASLLGQSNDFSLDNDWYHTGDIVEKVDERSFKFVSRKTEMINVGGYKINPNEVEEVIKQIDGIIDVQVTARQNRLTGNILVAKIVSAPGISKELLEKKILEHVSRTLQRWKIPRIFQFVDKVEITRTGKKVRQ